MKRRKKGRSVSVWYSHGAETKRGTGRRGIAGR
jgi:hypothetical protein